MSLLEIRTLDQGMVSIDQATLQALGARLRGPLLHPGTPGYDEARELWNGMIDKRPGLIVGAAGTADVLAAMELARREDLLVSVRGGGHNIAGHALCEGGMTIDLSRMRGVRVDPDRGRAWVQPGCAWSDVDRETQPFGAAVPSGIVSTTGVAGLTLGGGFGWLTRKYGLTCDNLVSADVVTAGGRLVRASEEENPDLFWALRGGGGNFGVVTSFEFALRPVGPEVLAGMRVFPLERGTEVIDAFRRLTDEAPDELGSLLLLRVAPPAPFLPEEVHGKPIIAIVICYAGPPEEGRRALAPLDALGEPLADVIAPKPFVAHQSMLDATSPHGRQYYWKSEYLPAVSRPIEEILLEHAGRITSPHSAVLLMHLAGEASRVDPAATAAPHRDAPFVLNIAGAWEDPEESEPHRSWVRDFWQAARPHGHGGTYVNFLTAEDTDRVEAAYGESREKLARVKATWDPGNRFRCNHNIEPAPAG